MNPEPKQEALRRIPQITELLRHETVVGWLRTHRAVLVTDCLRQATAYVREQILGNGPDANDPALISNETLLKLAGAALTRAEAPRLRHAINASGVILHTGLGRAVFAPVVVDSILRELKGCCTLAVDRESGERIERDELIEPILKELTGAEAATVVNNNAAATVLVLAALAAEREVIVSRGQLIEIGGSFRLPEVMAQSRARLVEVGATNRTHLKDYAGAVTPNTAALMRVHPSNYRIVGFTSQPSLAEMAELAHSRGLLLIDDLGAGAMMELAQFGLPHEPTVSESIQVGADVVLFSADKLIGAGQGGIVVGKKALIEKLRKHPLMRAVRVDKTCLLVLERTLQLFRDPDRVREHLPTYRMICAPMPVLQRRAQRLAELLSGAGPAISTEVREGQAYLGSGTLPTEAIPSVVVGVAVEGRGATALARSLRLDEACVFGRIEGERVLLDMRTVTDEELPMIAQALRRVVAAAEK